MPAGYIPFRFHRPGHRNTRRNMGQNPVFYQVSFENLQARSAEYFSIRVRLKNKIQSAIDLRRVFNRDRDRDDLFEIKV